MLSRSVRRFRHRLLGPFPGRLLGTILAPVAFCVLALGAAGCDRKPVACAAEPGALAAGPAVEEKPATPPPAAAPPSAPPAPAQAPAAQRAEKPEAAEPTATRLRIKRLVVAEGVDAREPLGPRSAFRADDMDKVYAFVEVDNPERLDGAITVSFEPPEGPEIGNVRLAVGASPRWRTWAYSRAVRQTGEWTAIVRDETGRIIAREPFSVTL
jgi:hypothetical protein